MEESTTSPPKNLIFKDDYSELFKWPEYLVFASVLVASMGIGVFYGFFNKKNATNEEFLMAGRQMSVFPVTLSLICRLNNTKVSPLLLNGSWKIEILIIGYFFV